MQTTTQISANKANRPEKSFPDNPLQSKTDTKNPKQSDIAGIPPIIAGIPPIIKGIPPILEGAPLRKEKTSSTEKSNNTQVDNLTNAPKTDKQSQSEQIKESLNKVHKARTETEQKDFLEKLEAAIKPPTPEDDDNLGSSFSKYTNLASGLTNLFSAGSILASIAKEYSEGKVDILGLKKGHEDDFAYGESKLSDKAMPWGEKFGWLTFKIGSLFNVIGCFAKYFNTKNPIGILGGLLSLAAVPIQEKISGTLMSTIAFSLVAIGLGKEGDLDYLKEKDKRDYQGTIFNIRKIGDEIAESFEDAKEFLKNPLKHLPHKSEAKTKVLMNFIAYLNTFAATGGILGRAFDNLRMTKFFVKIDKVSTALQSVTELIQGLKEKWKGSTNGTAARLSAIFQVLGAFIFTPAALIYDSKVGKAVNALASGFYGLHAAMTSLSGKDIDNPDSADGNKLSKLASVVAWAAPVVGIISGLLFTKKESKSNPVNKLLKLIELNLK